MCLQLNCLNWRLQDLHALYYKILFLALRALRRSGSSLKPYCALELKSPSCVIDCDHNTTVCVSRRLFMVCLKTAQDDVLRLRLRFSVQTEQVRELHCTHGGGKWVTKIELVVVHHK